MGGPAWADAVAGVRVSFAIRDYRVAGEDCIASNIIVA